VEDLVGKVLAFIADYNRTATPLRWTYDVRSLRHALGSIVGVVSELGEVLELLHDAAGRVTTLSATLGEWWDEQQAVARWRRRSATRRGRATPGW
jgi:hypothetical protein